MARIKVDIDRRIGIINPSIYGGFIEHLGRCIYGGIYDESSPLSDERGFRKDVLGALKALRLPNLRYPGGNFVSGYHWQDGVGPKEKRPRKMEFAWHTVESNRFGTDEFIEYCRSLETEPFLCVNLGSGTPEEAAAWVEYCNGTEDSHYANMRKANGYPEPHNVKYWGLGNEMGGYWQICAKNAGDYAKIAVEAAKMMRWVDPTIKLIGCGFLEQVDPPSWNLEVVDKLAGFMDYISLHIYTGNSDYYTNVAGPVRAQRLIDVFNATITIAMAGKKAPRPEIAMDEWNVWYKTFGSELEEQYDLSDALTVAGFLNVMHRNCTTVTLSNLAQMVNVIAPIFTSPEGLFLQTIYHPFKVYRDHCHRIALDAFVDSSSYETRVVHEWSGAGNESPIETVPYLDVSATLNEHATELSLAVINRHKDEPIETEIHLGDFQPKRTALVYEINGSRVDVQNSFSEPDNVTTTEKRFEKAAGAFKYQFPAHSITLLKLARA
ncbi:MAG: alpha-N-arabinofuranosidase [Candidatus Abyssobacteria bacterium SURF_17]|uniref:non-reducing end alpha-L-arabinofuranosidase n=1 Tax=Candidatus Abyssobacteria bacterium SURF_17 TaxID=2093361 RepID=A0A419F539_9BACT|nr:MAG: alpha-N-arabinofuranosidase [Candidatus Abyssubacteria bacterium SURF_17]